MLWSEGVDYFERNGKYQHQYDEYKTIYNVNMPPAMIIEPQGDFTW